jgi:DNA primase
MPTVANGDELVKNGIETYVIRLSGEKDPDEYIIANGGDAFLENVNNPLTFFEFKMNYFKQNKNLENVEDLTEYINNVLKSLASNDDPILREVTLKKLAKDHDLSLDVLKKKLEANTTVEVKKDVKEPEKKIVPKKDKYMKGAEKILYFMMNGEEYVSEYQKKLGYFSEAVYREIANEIIYFCESNETITVADFITYVTDKSEIKDKVMEIVNDSINDEVTLEAMDEYILAVSKVMTQNEIKRLKNMMKNELDADKKMKIAMQIVELKKEEL